MHVLDGKVSVVKEAGEHLSQEQWPEPRVHVTRASGPVKGFASRDSDAQSASLALRCSDLAIFAGMFIMNAVRSA